MSKSEATHTAILDAADALFTQHGYKAVSLRDIARGVGVKHTAIYYYAKNKEALYIQVVERRFAQHQAAMTTALAEAEDDLRAQLRAVADWLLTQTPTNMSHMLQSDFAALAPEHADRLGQALFTALTAPLEQTLRQAQARGLIRTDDPAFVAISFVALMQTVSATQFQRVRTQHDRIIENTIDLFLNGLLVR